MQATFKLQVNNPQILWCLISHSDHFSRVSFALTIIELLKIFLTVNQRTQIFQASRGNNLD